MAEFQTPVFGNYLSVLFNPGYFSPNYTQFGINQRCVGNFCFVYFVWFYHNEQEHHGLWHKLAGTLKTKRDIKEKLFFPDTFWGCVPRSLPKTILLELTFLCHWIWKLEENCCGSFTWSSYALGPLEWELSHWLCQGSRTTGWLPGTTEIEHTQLPSAKN